MLNHNELEKQFANFLINMLGPKESQRTIRESKFEILKKVIKNAISKIENIESTILCFGSYTCNTYLIDSDLDITIILQDSKNQNVIMNYSFDMINKIMTNIQSELETFNSQSGSNVITDINLIFAEVKLIKCNYEGINIDITINNFPGLLKSLFIDYLEKNFFTSLLYKKSMLIIKSWCFYESCILGSANGLFATYALEILVFFLFNVYGRNIENEIDALFLFIQTMKDIDFDNNIVTIFEKISIDSFFLNFSKELEKEKERQTGDDFSNLNPDEQAFMEKEYELMSEFKNSKESKDSKEVNPICQTATTTTNLQAECQPELVESEPKLNLSKDSLTFNRENLTFFLNKFEKFKADEILQSISNWQESSKKSINLKNINIIDPLQFSNNLGRSISPFNFNRIKKIFQWTFKDIEKIKKARLDNISPIEYLNLLVNIFPKTMMNLNPNQFYENLRKPKIIIDLESSNNTSNSNQENKKRSINSYKLDLINKLNYKFGHGQQEMKSNGFGFFEDDVDIANNLIEYILFINQNEEFSLNFAFKFNIKEIEEFLLKCSISSNR